MGHILNDNKDYGDLMGKICPDIIRIFRAERNRGKNLLRNWLNCNLNLSLMNVWILFTSEILSHFNI